MTDTLTVVLHRDRFDGGWWTEILECPGCFSHGADVGEALEHTADAFGLWNDDALTVSDIPRAALVAAAAAGVLPAPDQQSARNSAGAGGKQT